MGNVFSQDTNDSQCQIPTQQQSVHISNEVIVRLAEGNSTESNADFSNFDLPQREETDMQEQHMSISTDDIHLIHAEQPSDQNSQTSDFDMETSNKMMVGNAGDSYETPYQTGDDSAFATSNRVMVGNASDGYETPHQTGDDSDIETSNEVMAGNAGDGYETTYQTVLQDRIESHQYTQITKESNTSISSRKSTCEQQVIEKSFTKEKGYINLQF